MKVTVVGSGYVGLVSGACLSLKSHSVTCVDKNEKIVEMIRKGQSPIYEPGLEEIIKKSIESGNLNATTDLRNSVLSADIVLLAVGTPADDTGYIDLKYIIQAAEEIGKVLKEKKEYCCVVIKSTVIPGTTMGKVLPILERFSGKKLGDFGIGMNPEFLREGSAVKDFMNPDRIVIGASDVQSSIYMKELYSMFDAPKLVTSPDAAELIKYANNSLLAMLISFSNEMSKIAETLPEVDIKDVLRGIHLDHRFSPLHNGERIFPGILDYLAAGCGYGGSCFPKDVNALESFAREKGINTPLITATRNINNIQPEHSVKLLEHKFGNIAQKKIGVLGLSFKPDTDDVRETPAFKIILELLKRGAIVQVHDPLAQSKKNFVEMFGKKLDGKWTIAGTFEEVVSKCEIIFLVTPWKEYLQENWKSLINQYSNIKFFFDARRAIDPHIFSKSNCKYYGIGYPMRTL